MRECRFCLQHCSLNSSAEELLHSENKVMWDELNPVLLPSFDVSDEL